MNKGLKTILLIVGILGALYSVLTITNIFRRFKSPTISGYPNIKKGASFYSSILKKPQRFNLICFYAELPNEGRQLIVKRLCGIPGDKVEIKKGILYVNDRNADKDLNLSHYYIVPQEDADIIKTYEALEDDFIISKEANRLIVNFSDTTVSRNRLPYPMFIVDSSTADEEIQKVYGNAWNIDYFGPIIIPTGKYFVLGDNRQNSLDARHLGLVDEKDFHSTVLFKD